MLEITKEDITNLNDTDLRVLVGRLCEAELYSINNDTCDVSYGGNQDEKDGGIDVNVSASKITNDDGFIFRNNTIFQIKKPPMPPAKIASEMKNKNGSLRKCIEDLSKKLGAYIIVSSGDDLTMLTYTNRINAMKRVLEDFNLGDDIAIDFYDCNKIATWVRKYPSLICWVNDKNKKNTNGWTSYCNWSNRSIIEQPFIMNEDSVIYHNDFNKENRVKLIDGINQIRQTLSIEKSSVRLAGLSGVGKTRLAQALFDNSIGENALNKEMVIYGDVGDNLFPDPITFIQQLEKLDKKIILIVDNCEANMHNKLTELCQIENSNISLMTIEYDVKEDDNVDSNNFYLGTSSNEVIRKFIKSNYNEISEVNIDTIVNCSDGNFRIALYLAKSISNEKNIGVLKSNELFERLFYQGSSIDEELLIIGEVCCLFYSFDITFDLENENNELNLISKLINIEPLTIFRRVEELRLRQIVQKRGNMRAILPHALANKLAMDFLSKNPYNEILKKINGNSRLCLSFFRRLKFLHLSPEAKSISISFFESLKDMDLINANKNLLEKIMCITILIPEQVLYRIEKIQDVDFFSRNNKNFYEWIRVLAYIAYDEKLFGRAIELIIRFALTEDEDERNNSIRNILYGFFHIYLSYTYATLDVRLDIISYLLESDDINRQKLGLRLINELLETGPFFGFPIWDCGSQIRDYGLEPNTQEWFESAILYCKDLLKKNLFYEEIKDTLTNNFMDLSRLGFYSTLEEIVEENLLKESWPRLWVSLLTILHFDSEKISPELSLKIHSLVKKVRPSTIQEKIAVYLNKGKRIYYELDDTTEEYDSIDDLIYGLGKEIALDINNFEQNILLLDNTCDAFRINFFSKGLFEIVEDKKSMVYTLLNLIKDNNEIIIKRILSTVICLYNEYNHEDCSIILDELIENEKYNKYFCYLQFSYKLTKEDLVRIEKGILLNIIGEKDLDMIEWCLDDLISNDIVNLFSKLPDTLYVKNVIINCLFRICKNKKADEKIGILARKVLSEIEYKGLKRNYHDNYVISELIKDTFTTNQGREEAICIFYKINSFLNSDYISFYDYADVLTPLIQLYPIDFLDIFIDYSGKPNWYKKHFFRKSFNFSCNIISLIDYETVISWAKQNRKEIEISYMLEPYVFDSEKEYYKWNDLGMYFIDNYYKNETICENLVSNIFPNSWSNEYSTVLKKRVNLFEELKNNSNPIISNIGKIKLKQIMQDIDYYLEKEKSDNEERFNSFE